MPRILIFANGTLPDLEAVRSLLLPDDLVIAADGGTRHALALGLMPAVVIGDLDSLSEADMHRLESAGTSLVRHPQDKDETDLELAIRYAFQTRPGSILILCALGGRLDQTLGNLALLGDPALADLDVRADDGVEEAFFCRSHVEIRGQPGDIVSLLPWGGPVEGVRTEGLKWPLRNETLYPQKTRGISNELTGEAAKVEIASGLLLVVHRR
jgi:thiamine pyrophosphokinase